MQNANNNIERIGNIFKQHYIEPFLMKRRLEDQEYEKYFIDFNLVPDMLDELKVPNDKFMKLAVISGDNENFFEHASPMIVKKNAEGNYDIVMLMPDNYFSGLKELNRLNVLEPVSKDVSPIPKIGGGCLEITFATLKNLNKILTSQGNEINYEEIYLIISIIVIV